MNRGQFQAKRVGQLVNRSGASAEGGCSQISWTVRITFEVHAASDPKKHLDGP